jgi:hypothetical protein
MFYRKRLQKIEEQQARIIKELSQQRTELEQMKDKINSLGRHVAITHFDTEEYALMSVVKPEVWDEMQAKKAEYEGKLRRFIRSAMPRRKSKPKADGKENTAAAE